MENKRLTTIKLSSPAKPVKTIYEEGSLTIEFDTPEGISTVRIADHHDKDCCEHVYADWPTVQAYEKQLDGNEYKELELYGVENMGFVLCFVPKYGHTEKIFVPCYNEQNGYYSSNLELMFEVDGVKTTVDISNYVEDNTY